MLKVLEWAVPLFVSVLLIEVVADMLYVRAVEYRPALLNDSGSAGRGLPVHVIDREAASGSIIT
jgi:hypothetical protein